MSDWQISTLYEFAMNYTTDYLRSGYWKKKDSLEAVDDSVLADPDMGYTAEDIAEIRK
ncbi:hypothetical protein FACS189447_03380 [Spirochaetia bacterium]|nr:hypothetical protein FACS189447_03380 [Spirochaetia bacterium]